MVVFIDGQLWQFTRLRLDAKFLLADAVAVLKAVKTVTRVLSFHIIGLKSHLICFVLFRNAIYLYSVLDASHRMSKKSAYNICFSWFVSHDLIQLKMSIIADHEHTDGIVCFTSEKEKRQTVNRIVPFFGDSILAIASWTPVTSSIVFPKTFLHFIENFWKRIDSRKLFYRNCSIWYTTKDFCVTGWLDRSGIFNLAALHIVILVHYNL